VRRPVRAGGFTLLVREKRKDLYIPCTMTSNNRDWDMAWFYTSKILMERPDSWSHGMSPAERQSKLKVYTDALQRLAEKGLMATAVVANFHW